MKKLPLLPWYLLLPLAALACWLLSASLVRKHALGEPGVTLPASSSLGTPQTLHLCARGGLFPPDETEIQRLPQDSWDFPWPISWRLAGITWNGFLWRAELPVWPVQYNANHQRELLRHAPTASILAAQAVTIPQQGALRPVWTPNPPARKRSPWMDFAAILFLAIGIVTLLRRFTPRARLRRALLHAQTPSQLDNAVRRLYRHTRIPGNSPEDCAVALRNANHPAAELAESLARRLERARFAPVTPPQSLEQARTLLADFDSLKALASLVGETLWQ